MVAHRRHGYLSQPDVGSPRAAGDGSVAHGRSLELLTQILKRQPIRFSNTNTNINADANTNTNTNTNTKTNADANTNTNANANALQLFFATVLKKKLLSVQ